MIALTSITQLIQDNERLLSFIAGILIIFAQARYLINTYNKAVSPSILSWYGWAALMGTSFISQLLIRGWQWNFMGIILSTIGSITIGTTALLTNNFSFNKRDYKFILLSFLCIGLYTILKNPLYTTIFAILSDLVAGIPTIKNAYKNPASEKSNAWLFGLFSWTITLLICINQYFIYALFPIYLFTFNGLMVILTARKKNTFMY